MPKRSIFGYNSKSTKLQCGLARSGSLGAERVFREPLYQVDAALADSAVPFRTANAMDVLETALLALLLLILVLALYELYLRSLPSYKAAAQFPGPRVYPLIQNVFAVTLKSQVKTFYDHRQWALDYGASHRFLVGGKLFIHAIRYREVEMLLSSPRLIRKSPLYNLLLPFIGDGLLSSSEDKWHHRRRLLTPTFHFNILQSFLQTFHEECSKMVRQLHEAADKGLATDLQPLSTQVTLNAICETAMGIKLDSTEAGDLYKQNVRTVGGMLQRRLMNPLLWIDAIYKAVGYQAKFDEVLAPVHAFTRNIIKLRRQMFHANVQNVTAVSEEIIYTAKQRYAMLDSLLLAESKQQIDDEGIREEVDTFTFEGHDTTGSAFVFILLMMANHPDVQERVYDEIRAVMNGKSDPTEPFTIQEYNNLKYLERVIKECMRLFPPVPLLSRTITEDVRYDGDKWIPRGSVMSVEVFNLHRDPEQFPDPERFDPDRFLPENVEKRNPYAYIPFSAGPRNCLGQRFAMLELKAIVTAALREFRVLPVTKREELVFVADMVLRTRDPIKVKFERRNA